MINNNISRRDILKLGTTGALGIAGSIYLNKVAPFSKVVHAENHTSSNNSHSVNHTNIQDTAKTEGYKMAEKLLTTFDYGKVSNYSDGQTLREYEIVAIDKEIEIAKGIKFPGWTYNGTIPGPTFRCTEGDLTTVSFYK